MLLQINFFVFLIYVFVNTFVLRCIAVFVFLCVWLVFLLK